MSRIDDLLSQMTLDEKISMLAGADLWHSVACSTLGHPAIQNNRRTQRRARRMGQHVIAIGCNTGWHCPRRNMES